MERGQEIKAVGCGLLETIIKERLEELQDYFFTKRDFILDDLQKKITLLCKEAYDLQMQEQKEPIRCLSISHMQHCVYTKQYEMRLDLYNKDFYLDPQKVYQYCDMSFLFQFFEKDMEYFCEHIRFHIQSILYPLREYEEKKFALWYIKHYYRIAESFFQDQMLAIFENTDFELLKKEEDFMILYGGYMEEQKILFQSEVGRSERG